MVWAPSVWQARWLPPSGDCGSVASCRLTMANHARGRRPGDRPGGDDSDPGLASRRERGLTATKRCTLKPAWTASMRKGAGGPKTLERAINIIVSSLNDDITHATDVLIVGKRVSVSLSVDLVVVCCLPSVAPSAPCRRAVKVSRLRSSCLSLTSSFPH